MATIDEIQLCQNRWMTAVQTGNSLESLAQESLIGCRLAVEKLGVSLVELGYPVLPFVRPARNKFESKLSKVERVTGVRVPAILRAFWSTTGGISLVDLDEYKHVEFWDEAGITGRHSYCDGVYVDECTKSWIDYVLDEFECLSEDEEQAEFRYSFAPDGYHKDDISGGDPYCLGLHSDWAPAVENFEWSGRSRPITAVAGPPDFVSYLRTAILECGGFPGLFGHPKFEPIRQKLVTDLPAF